VASSIKRVYSTADPLFESKALDMQVPFSTRAKIRSNLLPLFSNLFPFLSSSLLHTTTGGSPLGAFGKMSLTVFPPETVEHILSSGLEQQDVLASMKTTRQFLEIARPLIYRSIVIRSHHQFDKFKEQVAPEDVGKVRTVSIVGKGNPWEKDKLQGVADWFRQMEESERDTNQAGTVERLFKGELLNANRALFVSTHSLFPRSANE
jgi:hypothetical protein